MPSEPGFLSVLCCAVSFARFRSSSPDVPATIYSPAHGSRQAHVELEDGLRLFRLMSQNLRLPHRPRGSDVKPLQRLLRSAGALLGHCHAWFKTKPRTMPPPFEPCLGESDLGNLILGIPDWELHPPLVPLARCSAVPLSSFCPYSLITPILWSTTQAWHRAEWTRKCRAEGHTKLS